MFNKIQKKFYVSKNVTTTFAVYQFRAKCICNKQTAGLNLVT